MKLGNSHAGDGLTLEHFKMRSLSLTGVAQSYEYDLAMLKMFSNQIEKNAIIIINVSPISFSQWKPDKAESLQYMYYDGRLSPFVLPNIQIGDYLQSQIIPFVRAIYLWRDAHAKKVKEIAMNSYAAQWPKLQEETKDEPIISNPSGPETQSTKNIQNPGSTQSSGSIPNTVNPKKHKTAEEDLAAAPYQSDERLQNSVIFMVNKWYHSGGFGTQYFDTNSQDLEKLIKYSLQKKWRPILIAIPISQRLSDGLGNNYLQTYVYEPLKKTNTYNSEFIDFSEYKQLRKNAYLFSNSDRNCSDSRTRQWS